MGERLGGDFPRTTWGMLRGLASPEAGSAGLEQLCRRYREPIFRYARAAWPQNQDDAEDVTQEFFLWLLEADVLRKYTPERGSFRSFLKGVLRNFALKRHESARRLKRGGGKRPVPLDDLRPSGVPDSRPPLDPDAAFEEAWRQEVMKRAIERVRAKSGSGRAALEWAAFEGYDLKGDGERPTYAELAKKLGKKESDVRNYLFAARERLRAAVRDELEDTVATARDLDAEWEHVVGK